MSILTDCAAGSSMCCPLYIACARERGMTYMPLTPCSLKAKSSLPASTRTSCCCDSKPSAGEVSESFFDKKNVFCQNISSDRTKQAFMLPSQKVLANLETALLEM